MMNKVMRKAKGFTLIELMIVVAIVGILAAIAIPKFADLVTKSKEAAVKGSLGALRSSVSIYYSDLEGIFPTNLSVGLTTDSKYISDLPNAEIPSNAKQNNPGHSGNRLVLNASGFLTSLSVDDQAQTTVWIYSSSEGEVRVNCSHFDTKSSIWSYW